MIVDDRLDLGFEVVPKLGELGFFVIGEAGFEAEKICGQRCKRHSHRLASHQGDDSGT
jgi:hypothetical protein